VEPQHPQPGQNASASNPNGLAGWHHDPMGRFEYRYFNGVQWTSDVSVNGQRYVDAPIAQFVPQIAIKNPPRGKAIAAFVLAISALFVGWIPFVFVLATGAAICAIVFGVLGLKAARLQDGFGRGFAVAGLALSPFALAVCVGGFFFTQAVVREVRGFTDPGPNELFIEPPCVVSNGTATLHGRIHNLDGTVHDYRIIVHFDDGINDTVGNAVVSEVQPDATAVWAASAPVSGTSAECNVTNVFGPIPFGVDLQS
jgi:Protein of unknown function (DUF2510)